MILYAKPPIFLGQKYSGGIGHRPMGAGPLLHHKQEQHP